MEGLIKKDIPGIEIGMGPQGVKAWVFLINFQKTDGVNTVSSREGVIIIMRAEVD